MIQVDVGAPFLSMEGITKQFPGVVALSGVSLTLYPGEILGLIGENGAGKSTLMSVLGGIYAPDAGRITIGGKTVRLGSVNDALVHGVSIIHQELNLAVNLDIASNILLGREPVGFLGRIKRKRLLDQAAKAAEMVGLTVPLSTTVEELPTAQQQMVEIAKALSMSSKILVLDEPTSSLSPRESEALFAVMRSLRERGVSMIYISHRLNEIEEMCDRAVVLRDGAFAGELKKGEINRDAMVRLMVGRDVSRFFPEVEEQAGGEPVLSVRSLTCKGCRGEFSFDVYPSEVLGVAGLVGAGRTELAKAIFGVEPATSGKIMVGSKETAIRSTRDAIKAGIALVPEDRKELGLLLEMSIRENISLAWLTTNSGMVLDGRGETSLARSQSTALAVKTPTIEQTVGCLSGGNQQKVALAKWLSLNPKVLILDEPTRGIDVGSKSEIYKLIRTLTGKGMAVMMISSEMEEVIGLSDRVLVMHEGEMQGILSRSELSEERIMQMATGGMRL